MLVLNFIHHTSRLPSLCHGLPLMLERLVVLLYLQGSLWTMKIEESDLFG